MTSGSHNGESASLYLHFPCFDGIVSGALALLLLGKARGWRFDAIHGINYDLQPNWLNTHLPPHSCVVDFLYHPEAECWCDHHITTFLNSDLRAQFAARDKALLMYDPESRSAARLLWNRGAEALGGSGRLDEMVQWADKIDAADYDGIDQALFGAEPALEISRSLSVEADTNYCDFLVRRLCDSTLRDLAAHAEVQRRLAQADELVREGLREVGEQIELQGNVAVFDVVTEHASVNRYSAFYLYPDAQYSIGTIRSSDSVTVRINANPWLHFHSPNLGELMRAAAQKAGLSSAGGGRERIGSLRLDNNSQGVAREVVSYLVQKLHGDLKGKEGSQWQRAVRQ
ncbi:MAG TPA: hypothetical protein VKH81_11970 [Candidatus Angelobacter sp.]|nr:hypothetical protein [Candidatus Angelobacter sp.]